MIMKKRKKITIILCSVFFALIILAVIALWQGLAVRHYTEITDKVSENVRIAHISDLHDTMYGDNQKELIAEITNQAPDIIVMTGDLTVYPDDISSVEKLINGISKDIQCYYVVGNHECWTGRPKTIKDKIRSCGVTVLEGNVENVTVNGQTIQIGGLNDPDFYDNTKLKYGEDCKEWVAELNACSQSLESEKYSVLLSHRPEETDKYAESGFDLVLAGHAHGGQVRVPFIINGLYAPNQGVFPKYAGGQYKLSDTTDMIVSRGLIKEIYPPRVFNRPELIIIDIAPEN